MLRILVDTCVWLDIAKDHQQLPLIASIEKLAKDGKIELAVPQVVLDEFARNKERVVADAQRSLSSHLRVVCKAVERFADAKQKAKLLQGLREVDHRMAMSGQSANESIERIDILLRSVSPVKTTTAIKARVADRAIARLAPYHRSKNSVGDAILVEIYAELAKSALQDGTRCAFATHNTRDFSEEKGDVRLPHADLAALFQKPRSTYWTSLADLLHSAAPETLKDDVEDLDFTTEYRRLGEIAEAEDKLTTQIWYDRHLMRAKMIAEGRIKVLPEGKYSRNPYRSDEILDPIWEGALASARKVEKRIGKKNLGPWSEFEWGMLTGKLSTIRWVMGDDWDNLDT